tara:strand:+ start:1720 stop:2613 length:894 start_codon:yes stop_codon:yes gene_type:complete
MKKLIARIAEGLGNQLFMYSHSYSLSKKLNYTLFIDDTSGYFKNKNKTRNFELNYFNISGQLSDNKFKFDSYVKDFKRKILKKTDFFNLKKNFLIEKVSHDKFTSFTDYTKYQYSDLLFTEGHFESEKYFSEYAEDLKKQFLIKKEFIHEKNQYISLLNNTNSVSICIRQNRYSEGKIPNKKKSYEFTVDTINYVKKSINYFKNKIKNPKFFIWSNDFNGLNEHFNINEFIFIENKNNKSINDFNLFKYAKHFIVGPTSFHWWGSWLNENHDKICLRPSNINPSNNKDFWPDKWISI